MELWWMSMKRGLRNSSLTCMEFMSPILAIRPSKGCLLWKNEILSNAPHTKCSPLPRRADINKEQRSPLWAIWNLVNDSHAFSRKRSNQSDSMILCVMHTCLFIDFKIFEKIPLGWVNIFFTIKCLAKLYKAKPIVTRSGGKLPSSIPPFFGLLVSLNLRISVESQQ